MVRLCHRRERSGEGEAMSEDTLNVKGLEEESISPIWSTRKKSGDRLTKVKLGRMKLRQTHRMGIATNCLK